MKEEAKDKGAMRGAGAPEGAGSKRWRTYRVQVGSYGSEMIAAKSRSQAVANAWRSDAFSHLSFKEFLTHLRPRAYVVKDLPKHNDGYSYVRRVYGVDPTIGQRVTVKDEGSWNGKLGTVVFPGPSTAHVHVVFDGLNHALIVHPSSVVLDPSPASTDTPTEQDQSAPKRAPENNGAP